MRSVCSLLRVDRRRPFRSVVLEQSRKLGQERLVGKVETQRRDRDAVVGERGEVGAVLAGRAAAARIGDPVIRIAAAVMARVDVQQLLVALALGRDRDALDLLRRAIGKVDVDQDVARDAGFQHAAR